MEEVLRRVVREDAFLETIYISLTGEKTIRFIKHN
jgi:hypothetical protein